MKKTCWQTAPSAASASPKASGKRCAGKAGELKRQMEAANEEPIRE